MDVPESRGMEGQDVYSPPRRSVLREVILSLWRDRLAFFSLLYIVILLSAAILAPLYVGDRVTKVDFSLFLLSPGEQGHILGTDALGRDLLTRILVGSRYSLFISGVVVVFSAVAGVVVGVAAGFRGGWLDDLVMRLIDLLMAFPSLLLVLVVIFITGNGLEKVILVLVATGWTGYARIARAETLRIREYHYVEAARAVGCSGIRIILRHIIPNLYSIIAALSALGVVSVIMTESGLSFLGLGLQPPDVSWGLLIAEGRNNLAYAWWLALFPGAAIFLTAMAFSLLSNWIGVAVDPAQRHRVLAGKRRGRQL